MKPLLIAVISVGLLGNAMADNWPQWRGPDDNGLATPGDYPLQFSAEQNLSWKVTLPGRGSSTPAVWRDNIFVTCPIDDQDGVVCYDFQGNQRWQQQLGSESPGKHRNGTGSNPSPVTDGTSVVVYYKSGTVACLDMAGKFQWQLNLQEKYGPDTLWWDLGTSPVLADGKVVVAVMQADDSYLVALDVTDGKVLWKQPRMFDCQEESDQAYTTPSIRELDGRKVVITWGADHLTGHDLATGDLLWQCGGFNPDNQGMWRVIASAAVDDQMAVVPYGRGEFLAAVDLRQAQGDITSTHRLWETAELSSDVPTPLIVGDLLLLLHDKGTVHAFDKRSGQLLWKETLPRARDKYFASPVLAGDTLYCTREDGVIMVGRITDGGLELLAENTLGESVIATPIPLRDQLLVRGERHLFLFGK